MPAYESKSFRPPAPVALVSVRSPESGAVLPNIAMLLDSGADITLLPRDPIAELIREADHSKQCELESFDGTRSMSTVVNLELIFLQKSFRGQFLLVEGTYGILGRNILNNLSIVFDGPSLNWSEVQTAQ